MHGYADKLMSSIKYTGALLYETIEWNHWLLKFFVFKEIKVFEQVSGSYIVTPTKITVL